MLDQSSGKSASIPLYTILYYSILLPIYDCLFEQTGCTRADSEAFTDAGPAPPNMVGLLSIIRKAKRRERAVRILMV